MSFNPITLGARLREARENRALSQQAVADAIGLPRTAITQLEAGKRAVSTFELSRLAELYRRSILDFFQPETIEEDDLLVALHRLAPGIEASAEVKTQVQHCLNLCMEGCALERLLGRPERSGPPAYAMAAPKTPSEAVQHGEYVAAQERKRLGLGATPISDMSELIADQGIWSSGVHLPDEMSGLFLRHASISMAILVNYTHARARKRFSYAHEYAHALLDRDRTATVSTRENAPELIEKRANAFAAAFLMPADGVTDFIRALDKGQPSRQEHAIFDVATEGRIETQTRPAPGSQAITHQDAALLAHHFGVSYQAAVFRLRSLSLVSQAECHKFLSRESEAKDFLSFVQMLDDMEQRESREREERELKTQIIQLAIEAYRREEISRGRLLDLSQQLGVSGAMLIELAEAVKDED